MNQLFLQHPEWSTLKKILMFHGATAEQLTAYEASGNPVVFETNVSRPLKRLTLSLLPRQSGTGDPSPENIRPLIPWGDVGTWTGGKNLFDIDELWDNGTNYGSGEINRYYKLTVPNGKYTVSTNAPNNTNPTVASVFVTDRLEVPTSGYNGVFLNTPRTIDIATKELYILIRVSSSGGYRTWDKTTFADYYVQVEIGQTATTYEEAHITPHPVNLRKNLLNAVGQTAYMGLTDGIYTLTTIPDVAKSFTIGTVKLKQGESYILSGGKSSWLYVVLSYNGTNYVSKTGDSVTLTATGDDTVRIAGVINTDSGMVAIGEQLKPMLRLASETDDTFQPYLLPVYGCSVDLTTGEVWGTWKEIVKTWGDFTNKTSLGDNTRGTLNISAYPSKPSIQAVDAKCNVAPRNTGWSTDSIHFYTNEGSCIVFLPNDTDASTEIHVVYPLATPVLLATLTPQQINALIGVNTVWSDADDIELTYLKKG